LQLYSYYGLSAACFKQPFTMQFDHDWLLAAGPDLGKSWLTLVLAAGPGLDRLQLILLLAAGPGLGRLQLKSLLAAQPYLV